MPGKVVPGLVRLIWEGGDHTVVSSVGKVQNWFSTLTVDLKEEG